MPISQKEAAIILQKLPTELNTALNQNSLVKLSGYDEKLIAEYNTTIDLLLAIDKSLINQLIFDGLVSSCQNITEVGFGVEALARSDVKFINKVTIDLLKKAGPNASDMGYGLEAFCSGCTDLSILTDPENIEMLLDATKKQQAQNVAYGYMYIWSANKRLVNSKIRRKLVELGSEALFFGSSVAKLGKRDETLVDDEAIEYLVRAGIHRDDFAESIEEIARVNDRLVNKNLYDLLLKADDKVIYFGNGLKYVAGVSLDLFNNKDIQNCLLRAEKNAEGVGYCLAQIGRVNQDFITQEVRDGLVEIVESNAMNLGYALQDLIQTDRTMLSPAIISNLIINVNRARDIVREYIRSTTDQHSDEVLPVSDPQNTHLKSVHDSSSISALRLLSRYYVGNLKDEKLSLFLKEIAEWVDKLSDNGEEGIYKSNIKEILESGVDFNNPNLNKDIHQLIALHWFVAGADSESKHIPQYKDIIILFRRDLKKFTLEITGWANTTPDLVKTSLKEMLFSGNVYQDQKSGISIKELMVLTWIAANDNTSGARTASLEDAKKRLEEAYSDIKKQYGSSLICTGGQFNKLIEVLVGSHVDPIQLVITRTQAAAKLQCLVKEQVYRYLLSLSNPKNEAELKYFMDLINNIKSKGVIVIWDKIKSNIEDIMIDEFGIIFDNDKSNKDFQVMISCGRFIELDNLDRFQQQVSCSEGYCRYMYRVFSSSISTGLPKESELENMGVRPLGFTA